MPLGPRFDDSWTPDSVRRLYYGILFLFAGIFLLYVCSLFFPPQQFPSDTYVKINRGLGIREIARILKQNNVVRSSTLLETWVVMFGGEKKVVAGTYYFPEHEGVISVAYRLAHGDFRIKQVKVTFPEGSTVKDITKILNQSLVDFDEKKFVSIASTSEGYLFPDTYFFSQVEEPEDVFHTLRASFDSKILPYSKDIEKNKQTVANIVTMASILEAEARTDTDRAIISGILWKRLLMGMRLQVDATFKYINGKSTFDLTLTDLGINSPYNTYRYKGLPKGPINNPGISAIEAALRPQASPYLYYLSDKNGVMHYSKTFEEHVANKRKYL